MRLALLVTGCAYLHQTRERRLTDHAAVTAELATTAEHHLAVTAADEPLALF